VEASITIIIIAMLAGIFLVAIGHGALFARNQAQRQTVISLKMAVLQFKTDYGFLPPVVKDAMPVMQSGGISQPNTYMGALSTTPDQDQYHLQGFTSATGNTAIDPDDRFSVNSLAYYLTGALDAPSGAAGSRPIDGAAGPAFTRPNEDGTFTQRGAARDAYFDFGKGGVRVSPTQLVINDKWLTPIRYYRWLPRPGKQTGNQAPQPDILIPRCVGDPIKNPALGGAEFAIVSLGPDKATDNGQPRRVGSTTTGGGPIEPTVNDDIVEVGP
jgi:hypothetical protein